MYSYLLFFFLTEKVKRRQKNGIDCTADALEMKSTTYAWVTVDFSVNTKGKVLHTLVFILIESKTSIKNFEYFHIFKI